MSGLIIEKNLDIDISLPWERNNKFANLLAERASMEIENKKKDIKERSLRFYTIDRVFVFTRDSMATIPDMEEGENGEVYYISPVSEQEIINGKHKNNFVIDPQTVMLSFSYRQQEPSEDLKKLPMTATVDTIKTLLPEKEDTITVDGNDIEIDGKKVAAPNIITNYSGVYAAIPITMYYDEKLFRKYLTEKEMQRASGKGITGINNIDPEITRNQIVDLYIKKIKDTLTRLYGPSF
jgi:hypothetical protein